MIRRLTKTAPRRSAVEYREREKKNNEQKIYSYCAKKHSETRTLRILKARVYCTDITV